MHHETQSTTIFVTFSSLSHSCDTVVCHTSCKHFTIHLINPNTSLQTYKWIRLQQSSQQFKNVYCLRTLHNFSKSNNNYSYFIIQRIEVMFFISNKQFTMFFTKWFVILNDDFFLFSSENHFHSVPHKLFGQFERCIFFLSFKNLFQRFYTNYSVNSSNVFFFHSALTNKLNFGNKFTRIKQLLNVKNEFTEKTQLTKLKNPHSEIPTL